MEIVVPFFERGQEIVERFDGTPRRLLQPFDPGVERGGLVNLQRLVRTIGGIDAGLEFALANEPMVVQRVGGVVRGAKHADVMAFQEIVDAAPGELRVGFTPDGGGRFGIQGLGDAKIARQLEMGPVIERIAQGVGDGRRPGVEFFLRRGVAGDEALGNSVRPHRAPFIMIAREPEFRQVAKLVIGGNLRRREMIVIIDDGLGRRVAMIKLASRLVAEQKIIVDEGAFHGFAGMCLSMIGWIASDQI